MSLICRVYCKRDCGCAYAIGRGLQSRLDTEQRASVIGLLKAIAEADGCSCALERHQIAQLAGEFAIDPAALFESE